ncbi:hypothetical protein HHI36_004378 [Cryptolaemus montrouzieri]|uniref:DNA repair protein complementing XP-G cells n=1 Tax=Cryptolaemus montrouzieri TaxID=559131 RepID=A0ABD2NR69_9CUCU
MGVHGLWRLIEPSGKPVPVESLENKVLAVDVSIWLHQAIKGFQDAKGAPALNAHLLGVFHRVCKLLYFKVKPVFVFDGGVPTLKRETIAKRNKLKHQHTSDADRLQKQLLTTLIKHSAVNKVLSDKAKAAIITSANPVQTKETEDLYKLPELDSTKSSSDEEESAETDSGSPTKHWNLHNIDTKSEHFKSLPADVRHEILTDLKETRKQSSWGRLHELPTQSDDFSGFQMKRLLKRHEVQSALDEAAKEIGGHSHSLEELEEILRDQGVISEKFAKSRIASDENTRYLYIRNVKEALEAARLKEENKLASIKEEENKIKEESEEDSPEKSKADLELEEDLKKAIALSLQDQPSSSGYVQKKKLSDYSFLDSLCDEDFDSEESEENDQIFSKTTKLTSAQNYMMEYSGLAPNEIARIIESNELKKPKKRRLDQMKQNFEGSTEKMDNGSSELKVLEKTETELDRKEAIELIEPHSKKSKMIDIGPTQVESVEITLNSESDGDFEEVKNISSSQVVDNSVSIKEKPSEISMIIEESENMETDKEHKSNQIDSPKLKLSKPTINITEPNNLMILDVEKKEEEFKPNQDEFMSDSGDSEDFEDVPMKTTDVKKENVFEIKIETEKFEENEDLFADIFTPKIERESEQKVQQISDEKNTIVEIKKDGEVETNIEKNMVNKESSLLKDLKKKAEEMRTQGASKSTLSDEELKKIQEELSQEQIELRNEQGQKERLGANITDQMYKEAQELLELFGLPYVIAPMEAEAQCAFLESASLTDGTITDDSDIWLFGGKTVYKNFFNQTKHVLEYRAEDIKHHFKLTREQMILLALLVGSDYTVGLQGVGPVTALEILAAFPSSSASSFTLSHNQLLLGLSEFKSWFTNSKTVARGKNSLRNKLKNITFTENFPSAQVVQAYLNPTVDTSEEQFAWSKPDFVALVDFGRTKFGWSKTKTEEILKPVIKKMKETKYQSTLLKYFQIKHNLNAEDALKLMSGRVKAAVKRIGRDPKETGDSDDFEEEEKPKQINKSNKDEKKNVKKSKAKKKSCSNDTLVGEFIEGDELEAIFDDVVQSSENALVKKSKKGGKKVANKKVEKKTTQLTDKDAPNEGISADNQKPTTSNHDEKIDNTNDNLSKEDEKLKSIIPTSMPKSTKTKNSSKQIEKKNFKPNARKAKVKKEEFSNESALEVVEDEELKILQATEALSEKRIEEIKKEAEKRIEEEINKKRLINRKLHSKEYIPQKERDQRNLVRTRLKAIEVFRKSKIDPPKKKGGVNKANTIKDDAGLSESSSDSDL